MLFFAKGVSLKSFFYMIRGTKNKPESINNRCQKEVRKNDAKRSQKVAANYPKSGDFILKSRKKKKGATEEPSVH